MTKWPKNINFLYIWRFSHRSYKVCEYSVLYMIEIRLDKVASCSKIINILYIPRFSPSMYGVNVCIIYD